MDPKDKIYLDSSVLCCLEQQDAPEKMQDSRSLWDLLVQGKYEVCLPEDARNGLEGCSEERLALLHAYLQQLPHHSVGSDEKTAALANRIISLGILPQKHYADCLHLAGAILSGCNVFVSWSRHIATYKVSRGISALTLLEGCPDLAICLPSMLLGEDEEEEDTPEQMLEEPVLSDRFDLEDIRKIRAYNSQRYLQMSAAEILEELHEAANRFRAHMEQVETAATQ